MSQTESLYISSPERNILYNDIVQYVIPNVGNNQSVNNLITSGISRLRGLLLVPILSGTSNACNGLDAKQYYENNKTQLLEKSKEYRIKNIEEIKKVKRNYYITNKDIIQEKKSMKILCSCEKSYTKSNKQCHEMTKFHQNCILNNPV